MQIETTNQLLEQAQVFTDQAMELYKSADITAEDMEKAGRLLNEAKDLVARSDVLGELKAKRQSAIATAPPIVKEPEPEVPTQFSGYKSLGHWFKAVYHLKANQIMSGNGLDYWDGDGEGRSKVMRVTNAKALAEGVGATGGFLVPQEFQARVLQLAETETIVRPRAEVIRMNRRQVTIPALDQTGTVSGGFSWFGGVITYYTEEAGAMTESSMNFRDVTLTANELTAYTRSSNQLLDDSAVSLEDFLMSQLPRALTAQADYDYLQGSGAGKPLGIINSGATITVNREGTDNVTYTDLINMLAQALPSSNLMWVASQSIMPTLLAMNGPSGNASYLWGSAESGTPGSLLGHPIKFTDKLPALGTAGDIILVDCGYYLVGDRQAITVDMSAHERFQNNQTSWRAIMRHDGQPWLSAPITYRDGSTQVSPFVRLGDKST